MTVLIVGGAGFIGSTLLEKLIEKESVIVIDNFNECYDYNLKIQNILSSLKLKVNMNSNFNKQEKIENLIKITKNENFSLEYLDICNITMLEEIFIKYKIDMIINFAGLAGVRPSIIDPKSYEKNNIEGFINLLEMSKKYNVKKFIQASSSSVYGNNEKLPFSESDCVDFPISPYAATKKACELLGYSYFKNFGINMLQLRFFTVYGPKQRPDLAIYKFAQRIMSKEKIELFGDGTTFRDYTYIDDIVDGIEKGMKYLKENKNVYEIFNLGAGRAISLNEMVKVLEKVLGKKAKIEYKNMQLGDVNRTLSNIEKSTNYLGYIPKIGFEEGIKNFIEWLRKEERV